MSETERFVIVGWFEAADIDDAFEWLAQHFRTLADGGEEDHSRLCDLRIDRQLSPNAQCPPCGGHRDGVASRP